MVFGGLSGYLGLKQPGLGLETARVETSSEYGQDSGPFVGLSRTGGVGRASGAHDA